MRAGLADRLPKLPAGAFDKVDPGDDAAFDAPPRLVTHINEGAVTALTAYYRKILSAGGMVLDLMSSWVSHLPAELALVEIIGHGMNAEELAANPRLTRRWVQDLNRTPTLPLGDASLDAALCCVGVQYLQRPVDVFADVARMLRPGSPLAVSFSNRCFSTKAVAVWRSLDMAGHARLVQLYLERASGLAASWPESLPMAATAIPLWLSRASADLRARSGRLSRSADTNARSSSLCEGG